MRRLQLILVFYRPSLNSCPGTRRLGMEVAARAGAPKQGRGPRVTPRRRSKGRPLAEGSLLRQSVRVGNDGQQERRVMPRARSGRVGPLLARQPYALARRAGEGVRCALDAPLYQDDL
jgi:hypothetical protein